MLHLPADSRRSLTFDEIVSHRSHARNVRGIKGMKMGAALADSQRPT
jgi:hypothetical protein